MNKVKSGANKITGWFFYSIFRKIKKQIQKEKPHDVLDSRFVKAVSLSEYLWKLISLFKFITSESLKVTLLILGKCAIEDNYSPSTFEVGNIGSRTY